MSSVEGGHDMRQDRGILAAGRSHRDALARREQLVLRDGGMHFLLEGAVEAFPAQLQSPRRVRRRGGGGGEQRRRFQTAVSPQIA